MWHSSFLICESYLSSQNRTISTREGPASGVYPLKKRLNSFVRYRENIIDVRFPYLKQSLPDNAALPLISETESIARLSHESLGCDLLVGFHVLLEGALRINYFHLHTDALYEVDSIVKSATTYLY